MWGLIAEAAATMDAGAVGQMVATLVGAGVVGGGGYAMGKAKLISVKMADEYATKEDMRRLEREIAALKTETLNTVKDIYARVNEQAESLSEIKGMLKFISKSFNANKK